MKGSKSTLVGAIAITAAVFGTVATANKADGATVTTTPLDSVLQSYVGVHDLDIAPQVLSDLGKNDGRWWICRVNNLTPDIGHAQVVSDGYLDQFMFTAWAQMAPEDPEQTTQALLQVSLCQLPVGPEKKHQVKHVTAEYPTYNVGVTLEWPLNPYVFTYRGKDQHCHLMAVNRDPVLNADYTLYDKNGQYGWYDPAYPVSSDVSYVFKRHAPRRIALAAEFYDPTYVKSSASIYSTLSGSINTRKCTIALFDSYK